MGNLDVKAAVKLAKGYVADLFGEEGIAEIGLEEVDVQNEEWLITIGFRRLWNQSAATAIASMFSQRSYKVVHINDATKAVISVKNRDVGP